MANNDGQWNAALAAAAAAILVKALDLLGGFWSGRGAREEKHALVRATAETDERRDFIGEAKDLRERFDALQTKYAASLEERAILRGQNEALTLRVTALETQAKGLQEALETVRRQSAADRESFRRELDELRRRVPLGSDQ